MTVDMRSLFSAYKTYNPAVRCGQVLSTKVSVIRTTSSATTDSTVGDPLAHKIRKHKEICGHGIADDSGPK